MNSKDFDACSRCSSVMPNSAGSYRNKYNSASTSRKHDSLCKNCKQCCYEDDEERAESPKRRLRKIKEKPNHHDVDWTNLGDKIEDWFEYAKTPGNQKTILSLKKVKLCSNFKFKSKNKESYTSF